MSDSVQSSPKILVTSALPYANGPIHLGHLVEYLMTDIYVRFLKLRGQDAIYVCADDTHGTPIELNAAKEGVTPEQFIARWAEQHPKDFADFGIEFDEFYTTHSPQNEAMATLFFQKAQEAGLIELRTSKQVWSPEDQRFLPDRYVRGTCPRCKTPDQYGDSCENCGATYDPAQLIEPRSAISGGAVELRDSDQYYFIMEGLSELLRDWAKGTGDGESPLVPEVRNYITGWIDEGLRPWCISRDAPYFGFQIPGSDNKYFYVWMDAPIGYVSSTQHYAEARGLDWRQWWAPGDDARVVHVIGKDIVYFHTLFWPAMLKTAGLRVPDRVVVHGFLTVNGQKMSKSRGTFITAREYLDHLDPQYLRYYYAANLTPRPDDIDLNLEDFVTKVNAELVGNLANFCYRALSFCRKQLGGQLSEPERGELEQDVMARCEKIAADYEALELRKVVRGINELGDVANRYFQQAAPWALVKKDVDAARAAVTTGVNLVRALAVVMRPILPGLVADIEAQLGLDAPLTWADIPFTLANREIGETAPLIQRVDTKDVDQVWAKPEPEPEAPAEAEKPAFAELAPQIGIEDFFAADIRVGQVREAEKVPKSNKLLKLQVDIGEDSGPRQIVAGIGKSYDPEALVGRRVLVVANLKPAKLMGIESQGMVLAAGPGGAEISLTGLPDDAGDGFAPPIGTRVK